MSAVDHNDTVNNLWIYYSSNITYCIRFNYSNLLTYERNALLKKIYSYKLLLLLWLYRSLLGLASFISFWIVRTPWMGDQPVARPLTYTQNNTNRINETENHASSGIRTHDPSVWEVKSVPQTARPLYTELRTYTCFTPIRLHLNVITNSMEQSPASEATIHSLS
jgi:hypothetical protein